MADREGTAVSSIFDVGQSIESFGCNNEEFKLFANDGTTEKYSCDRKGIWTEDTGLLINPTYQKMTIVRKIRVYAANRCPNW